MSNGTLRSEISEKNSANFKIVPKKRTRIYLSGLMTVLDINGKNIAPNAKRTRAILAVLCFAKGRRVARGRLAGLLWDRSDESHAQTSVRQGLSDLNRAVGKRVPGLIEIDRHAARLNPDLCWIDIFDEGGHLDRLLEDLDGISSPFDRWLAAQRDQFEDNRREELEDRLNSLIAENAAPEMRSAAARELANFDRTHEGAARALMIAFAEMGNRAQSAREFARCRDELKRMDLVPSAETVAVYEAVRLVSIKSASNALHTNANPIEKIRSAEHPSIAVLPFDNLSPDTMHDYVTEGLVNDLTNILSRVPGFFVISTSTSAAFKGERRPATEIGPILGVRYTLSGSMRVSGDRLRLTAELTDVSNGNVIWRSSLVEKFFDLVEIQTHLADSVVRCIAPHLYSAEIRRLRGKRFEPLGAYDLLLRAQENMNSQSQIVFETCERLFGEAVKLDPEYAIALAWRAYWHVLKFAQGWSSDPAYDVKQATVFAQRAVNADHLEPMALAIHGHVAAYLHKDFDIAFERFDAALRSNPNAAPAWLWSAAAHAWIGEGAKAVEEAEKAIALSPFDPLMCAYSAVAGMAYLADAQYERAVEYALRSMGENRKYSAAYKLMLLALVLSDRAEEAQPYVNQSLRVEPGFCVERYRQVFPGSRTLTGKRYADALAVAGVPIRSRNNSDWIGARVSI